MTQAAVEHTPIAAPVADLNPIAWGQFHLRGGWKSFWTTTLGYAVLVGGGMLLVVRLSDGTPGALIGLKFAFTGLQAGMIAIFVCARVATAVRQDQTSKMIESHRLTPISPAQAVLGYMIGPAAQPLGLCAVNLLLGCALGGATGTPLVLWLTVNAVLLLFSAFATTLSVFGAFAGRPGGSAAGWIGAFVALVNILAIGSVLPAVNVLGTPLLGPTVFNMSVAGRDAVTVYAPSTVFQFLIAAVCFAGACRRYRRDDRPALGWDLGLAMMLAWVATSVYGILFWDTVAPSAIRGRATDPVLQFLGSIMATMVLALVPLAGAAWDRADWEGRRALGDTPRRRPPPPWMVALAAAVVTLGLTAAPLTMPHSNMSVAPPPYAAWRTAAVVVSFYLATGYVLRILVRVTGKLLAPLGAWVMVTCFVPIAVDYLLWWLVDANPISWVLSRASAFGPVGALIQIWTREADATRAGIVFQIALASGLAAVYHLTQPKGSRRTVAGRE